MFANASALKQASRLPQTKHLDHPNFTSLSDARDAFAKPRGWEPFAQEKRASV